MQVELKGTDCSMTTFDCQYIRKHDHCHPHHFNIAYVTINIAVIPLTLATLRCM